MEQTEILRSEKTDTKNLWLYAAAGTLLVASYSLFYGSTLVGLAEEWLSYISFSYCAAIPLMSLYVVWTRRQVLAKVPVVPSFFGFAVLGGALLIALLGKAVGESFAVQISLVIALAGLVQLILGTRFLKVILFPIVYLTLMVPLPYTIVKEVAYYLRMFNAVVAADVLQMMGIPVYRDAYFLHLPQITLEVADLCSGISSVFALFALGVYYAYFLPVRTSLKLVAIASTIPFAALVNLLRIILTSALAYYVGPVALGYLVHELTGTVTFFIALGLFIGLGEFLQGWVVPADRGVVSRKKDPVNLTSGVPPDWKVVGSGSSRCRWLAIFLGCAALLLGSYLSVRLEAGRPVALFGGLEQVPERVGDYTLRGETASPRYHDPNADREIARSYSDSHSSIDLFAGYRSYQSASNRLASPKLNLVPGWNIVSLEPATLRVSATEAVNGIWMILHDARSKQLVFYWYQTGSSTFGGEIGYRLFQIKRVLFENRSDAAVISISTSIGEAEEIDRAKVRIMAFVADLYPSLKTILPQ